MLTLKQRELLIAARGLIESLKEEFVCIALKKSYYGDSAVPDCDFEEYHALKKFVGNSVLIDHGRGTFTNTLNSWQRANGFGNRSDARVARDRCAWIDWLMDDWIEWKGGERYAPPVEGEIRVVARFRNGQERERPAQCFRWDHIGNDADIVAFKVVA